MITPTKGIAPQRALVVVGAQVLQLLDRPMTVSQTWARLKEWRSGHGHHAPLPFWWFVLSLDVLYALGVLELDRDLLRRRQANAAPAGGE
ncbi:hypothetical protein J2S43_004491 [Catenuloplanes nepalensis]|uniref:Uncharacterized protein n=1 Tax=Catenuloplanes nepalensis TaxID=587533 RepID=A0ABT9MX72_9ACTN|nr:ABC-three component system middle component 6 [Catenuloplanes nepalensis]MDP9795979.1 hypothetical protein [Catenuloplanes nepalensis]